MVATKVYVPIDFACAKAIAKCFSQVHEDKSMKECRFNSRENQLLSLVITDRTSILKVSLNIRVPINKNSEYGNDQ